MKNKIKSGIFSGLIIILIVSLKTQAQNPTFELRATNFTPLNQVTNSIEFDITLKWTNPGVAPNFEYAGGQYFFNFNASIANGGTLYYSNVGSDLPVNMQPRSPVVYTSTTPAQLRLAVNTFPGAGSGFQMPAYVPVKVIRMRLSTTAESFHEIQNFGIQWRDSFPNPYTKILAYVGTTNTIISDPPRSTPFFMDFPAYPSTNITVKLGIEGLYMNSRHQIKDSVLIFLRSPEAPFQILDTARTVIDSLTLTASFVSSVPAGNYYLVVRHRNSLETWSKSGGELVNGGNLLYDFTTSATQAYGNNLVLKNGLYCIYSGNINDDDIIDAEDLIHVDNDVYSYAPGTNLTNLNGDQIVDIEDLAICDRNARALRIVQWPGSSLRSSSIDDEFQLKIGSKYVAP